MTQERLYDINFKKVKKGLCGVFRCTNSRLDKRTVCSKHKHQRKKIKDPVGYIFDIKKQRAKERGHEWNLTREEFEKFCDETGYMKNRSRSWFGASIDRIDNNKGYEIGNIRVITVSENSIKGDKAPF